MQNQKNQPSLFYSEQLVSIQDNKVVTSSLQVANYFNKQHKDVLRAINQLDCSIDFKERNFAPSFYIRELEGRGQHKYPMYYMTKDGFSFLVMGFTGKQAAKFKEDYINAFNKMEEYIRGQQINEREISEFIIQKMDMVLPDMKISAKLLSKEFKYDFELMIPDAMYKVPYNKNLNLISNIDNIISVYKNNLLAGLFQTYKAYEYNRRLKEVNLHISKFIQNVPRGLDIY